MFIEVDDLETIIRIVEEGSFRAAAEKLNKAPSAITYSVKRIEEQLKTKVFDREEYRPKLTKFGEEVYLRALKIINLNSDLIDFASLISAGIENNINIVVDSITPQEMLYEIIKKFHKKFPSTNVSLQFAVLEEPQKMLSEGEADIAISYKPCNDIECESKIFRKVEFLPVSAPHHDAQKKNTDISNISEMTQVTVGDTSSIDLDLNFPSLNKLKQWRVLDETTKKNVIIEALAWGYMSKNSIDTELQKGRLKIIEALPKRTYCLHLIRKKTGNYGPAVSFLWDEFLNKALEEHIGFKMM